MIIETRHLELMAAVAEHGTLTRASRQLHVSQSALSHLLANLEARLRVALFHRVGRRLVPTAGGLRLLAAARSTLPHLQSVEEDLRRLVNGEGGVVRVSTECYTCYHWLPAVLKRIARRRPGLEVQIVAEATRAPLTALRDGRIDVAIATSAPAPFLGRPLFRDELVAVLPPDHPLARRKTLLPADFADQHLIVYGVPIEELSLFGEFLTPAGVTPARVSFIQLTEAILELVRAGLGISVLARWAVEPALARGTIVAVPVGRPPLKRQWWAITLPSERPVPHVSAFIEALLEEPSWSSLPHSVAVGTPRRAVGG